MDPLTHGLIGASASASVARKDHLRIAGMLGAAAAMLPDLDVLISNAPDPLLQLEYHRTITHSLTFIPVGALLVTGILWWFLRKRLSFKGTYLYSILGLATAGLTDVITSYGVQLLWPFTATRFSLNLISVFDPLFSLGLVIGLGWALYHKTQQPTRLGIVWMILYLLFGFIQQQKAENTAHNMAQQREHEIQELIVKPTIANQILWSIRYTSDDSLYADGIWMVPFADSKVYKGDSAKLLNWEEDYNSYKGTTLYRDIQRFDQLSNGVLVRHPDSSQVLGDGRYAMLPTSINPLWGIKIDTTQAGQHIAFETYRDAGPEVRSSFLDMIMGK